MTAPTSLAPLLERFFINRLMQQRQASAHTIGSYRDTFRQLLKFTQQRLHKAPSNLAFEQIDAPLIVAFLDHLEKNHGLSASSRNLRLTAVHSFFRYTALEMPAHSAQIQRVLAIPSKRFTRALVRFLSRPKWTHCSPHPTGKPGAAAEITRLSLWRLRRDCAFRK